MLPNEFLGKKLFVANATTIDEDWSDLLTDSTITTTIIWKSYHLIQVNQRLLQHVITSTAAVSLSLSHFIGSSMHRPTVINQRCNWTYFPSYCCCFGGVAEAVCAKMRLPSRQLISWLITGTSHDINSAVVVTLKIHNLTLSAIKNNPTTITITIVISLSLLHHFHHHHETLLSTFKAKASRVFLVGLLVARLLFKLPVMKVFPVCLCLRVCLYCFWGKSITFHCIRWCFIALIVLYLLGCILISASTSHHLPAFLSRRTRLARTLVNWFDH